MSFSKSLWDLGLQVTWITTLITKQNTKCKQQKARVFKIRHRYTKDKRWDKDKDRKWGVTLATLVNTCNLQNKIQNDQTMTYTLFGAIWGIFSKCFYVF